MLSRAVPSNGMAAGDGADIARLPCGHRRDRCAERPEAILSSAARRASRSVTRSIASRPRPTMRTRALSQRSEEACAKGDSTRGHWTGGPEAALWGVSVPHSISTLAFGLVSRMSSRVVRRLSDPGRAPWPLPFVHALPGAAPPRFSFLRWARRTDVKSVTAEIYGLYALRWWG